MKTFCKAAFCLSLIFPAMPLSTRSARSAQVAPLFSLLAGLHAVHSTALATLMLEETSNAQETELRMGAWRCSGEITEFIKQHPELRSSHYLLTIDFYTNIIQSIETALAAHELDDHALPTWEKKRLRLHYYLESAQYSLNMAIRSLSAPTP